MSEDSTPKIAVIWSCPVRGHRYTEYNSWSHGPDFIRHHYIEYMSTVPSLHTFVECGGFIPFYFSSFVIPR